jgi:hypothetical protein
MSACGTEAVRVNAGEAVATACCPRCGTSFCCERDGDCWCAKLPPRPMPLGAASCYCPSCLETIPPAFAGVEAP